MHRERHLALLPRSYAGFSSPLDDEPGCRGLDMNVRIPFFPFTSSTARLTTRLRVDIVADHLWPETTAVLVLPGDGLIPPTSGRRSAREEHPAGQACYIRRRQMSARRAYRSAAVAREHTRDAVVMPSFSRGPSRPWLRYSKGEAANERAGVIVVVTSSRSPDDAMRSISR